MTPSPRRPTLALLAALLLVALFLAAPLGVGSQEAPPAAEPQLPADSDSVQVLLVTLGPGEVVWERFGHNGLWIHRTDGPDRFYHWGVFSFEAEDFWPRLLSGHMRYAMVGVDPDRWLAYVRSADRTTRIQRIGLSPEETSELVRDLERTDTPEARWYDYDYYRDNCSTRARDALDRVLGGLIRRTLSPVETPHTYRWHTRRLLGPVPPAYLGIQLALGPRADRPLSLHEETFTPPTLADHLTRVTRPDGSPLVTWDRVLKESRDNAEPVAPRSHLPLYLLLGLAGGGLLALLGRAATRRTWARRSLALLGGLWGLAAGLMGLLLALAWAFTDHVFWYRNQTLLQISPLHLAVGVGMLFFLREKGPGRWMRGLAFAVAGLSAAGLLLHVLPVWSQANGEAIALLLPVNVGAAWAVWELGRRRANRGGRGPSPG